MNKIQTNIYIGYSGPILCTLGLLNGADPMLAFWINNFMFFAWMCIVFFMDLYENGRKFKPHTTCFIILYVIYSFIYKPELALISFSIICFWLVKAKKVDTKNIDFQDTTPFKLFIQLNNKFAILISVVVYLMCNVYFKLL